MTRKPIVFLTMDSLDGFCTYDHLPREVLQQRGWQVDMVSWRAIADWDRYGAVIIRSPWDYQAEPDAFLDVLRRIDQSAAELLNPLAIVEWNLRKTYLLELEQLGVPIIPTILGSDLTATDLPRLARELNTDELVLKPIVGANADGAFRIPAPFDGAVVQAAVAFYANAQYLAQPFLNSIITEGELSIFYFNGEYSHAIIKRPKSGDFRVQEEHGGFIAPTTPSLDAMVAAGLVVRGVNDVLSRRGGARRSRELLYSRIDLARRADGTWGLMEIELIEPSLYFNMDPASSARFADAVEAALSQ